MQEVPSGRRHPGIPGWQKPGVEGVQRGEKLNQGSKRTGGISNHDLRAGKNKASKGAWREVCRAQSEAHTEAQRGETVRQEFREKSQGWLGAEARLRPLSFLCPVLNCSCSDLGPHLRLRSLLLVVPWTHGDRGGRHRQVSQA